MEYSDEELVALTHPGPTSVDLQNEIARLEDSLDDRVRQVDALYAETRRLHSIIGRMAMSCKAARELLDQIRPELPVETQAQLERVVGSIRDLGQ